MADIIITDESFGSLKYLENAWCKRMEYPILNSDGNLILALQDDNKEGILDVQREAYKTYLQNEDKYKSCVTDFLLDYYKWINEYFMRSVSGIDETYHKDVITAEKLYTTMTLWYLFICRDGSFGYAFGCCWDKANGLAVLLSESEPRVISRTQLENLHKLNDPTFGLLVHDGKKAWKGLEINSFFGKPENLEIELEGSVEEGITEAQRNAYAEYLERKDVFFTKLVKPYNGKLLPKTLYIDRAGNYLWWSTKTDKYQLSEIRLAYKAIQDADFGELLNWGDKRWLGKTTANFNDNEAVLTIELESSANDKITDEQRKAYAEYKEKEGNYFKAMNAKAKKIYKDVDTIIPKTLFIDRQGNYGWMGSKTVILSDGDVQFAASESILYNYTDVVASRTKKEWHTEETAYVSLFGELQPMCVTRANYEFEDENADVDEEISGGKLTDREVELLLWLTTEFNTNSIADDVLEYCNDRYAMWSDKRIEANDLLNELALGTIYLRTQGAEEYKGPDISLAGECDCEVEHGIAIGFYDKGFDGIGFEDYGFY